MFQILSQMKVQKDKCIYQLSPGSPFYAELECNFWKQIIFQY